MKVLTRPFKGPYKALKRPYKALKGPYKALKGPYKALKGLIRPFKVPYTVATAAALLPLLLQGP